MAAVAAFLGIFPSCLSAAFVQDLPEDWDPSPRRVCPTQYFAGSGIVWGEIRDQEGNPVEEAVIEVEDGAGRRCFALSRKDGHYSITRIPAGLHILHFGRLGLDPDSIEVMISKDPQRLDFELIDPMLIERLTPPVDDIDRSRIRLPRDSAYLGCFDIVIDGNYGLNEPLLTQYLDRIQDRVRFAADTLGDGSVRLQGFHHDGREWVLGGWFAGTRGDTIWASFGFLWGISYRMVVDHDSLVGLSQNYSDAWFPGMHVQTTWTRRAC